MSRRAPRYRIDLAATAVPLLGGDMVVCRTRDVSDVGVCLDTAAWFPLGTRLSVALMDPATGAAFEVIGDVVREANAKRHDYALGIAVLSPPDEWHALVAVASRDGAGAGVQMRRLRVLVVGDGHRQRSAMALYVTSGWDVLFASDDDSVAEAVSTIDLDAVVAELDAADPRLETLMHAVAKQQPTAKRIARGRGRTAPGVVHRFVDRDAGLDALLDAVTSVET